MMNGELLLTQKEADNLLLHQRTELKLKEMEKTLKSVCDALSDIKSNYIESHKRMTDCKAELKKEIDQEYVTTNDFKIFELNVKAQWNKLYWTLAGGVGVLLMGAWLLTQYSIIDRITSAAQVQSKAQAKEFKSQINEAIKEALKDL